MFWKSSLLMYCSCRIPFMRVLAGAWEWAAEVLKGRTLPEKRDLMSPLPASQLRWEKAANLLVLWTVIRSCCEALWPTTACLSAVHSAQGMKWTTRNALLLLSDDSMLHWIKNQGSLGCVIVQDCTILSQLYLFVYPIAEIESSRWYMPGWGIGARQSLKSEWWWSLDLWKKERILAGSVNHLLPKCPVAQLLKKKHY